MGHNTTFIFVPRDRRCVWGKIKRIDDSTVTIGAKHSRVLLQRADLLRITHGAWAPGVIYSARSSWFDVESIVGKHLHPSISVITKSGQRHDGKLTDPSNDNLSLESAGKMLDISKDEISSVSFIRPKPQSDSAEYANDELAWMKVFDPQLWPEMLHLQPSISIRLYDGSAPEDNSRIVCVTSPPWPRSQPGLDVTRPAFPPPNF